jgi:hypothetical protein
MFEGVFLVLFCEHRDPARQHFGVLPLSSVFVALFLSHLNFSCLISFAGNKV